ncbi:MAG: hypothetical protein REI78_13585 [Pedobacter sp.]|nr:hypothetical protein [Pedobacter sp.]
MKKLLLALLIFTVGQQASAQVDTIHAQNHKLQLQNLKFGKVDYLVYFVDSVTQKRTVGDIWQRKTELATFQGRPTIKFTWDCLRNDTTFMAIVNYCDNKTLAPIYHYANYKGRGVVAFDYRNGMMVPSDTIKNNLGVKKGNTALTIPVISWEQDLETYALLPIKKVGQKFDIAFFDPNEKVPTYHRYEVAGKEDLVLNGDVKIKCWLLTINYGRGSHATFWLTENTKEVVKMKEYFNGKYRIKVRQF